MIYDDAPPPSFARPPIGVIPKWLWIEKMNDERMNQLKSAIRGYLDSDYKMPIEWIDELNALFELNELSKDR